MPDPEFILLGDALWLDFVNTAEGRSDPTDGLPDLAAYHRWTKAEKLTSDADAVPFDRVLQLRSILGTLADGLANGRQAPASAVELLNEFLAQAGGYFQLTRTRGKWQMRFTPGYAARASDAIAQSAARTLVDPTAHVHRCLGEYCTLFYIDDSSAQSRRWCSVEACGDHNRVERRRSHP